MAVLKLDPTRAPDFSASSEILARAGLSLDRGFEAAQGLLSSYQEGAQERVDNEVFAETAGMNREQLQAFFDKNGLKGRNLSQSARERLAGQFGTIADVNRTRGLTDSTADQTIRLNAVRAEAAAEEIDRLGARSFARKNAVGGVLAHQEALEQGLSGPGSAPVRPGVTPGERIAAAAGPAVTPPAPISGVPTVGGGSRAPAHLVTNESGGSFQAKNESVGSGGIVGHDGRVQAGAARLTDAKKAGVIPKDMTREQFRNDPKAQVAFENWHFGDIDTTIEKNGYSKYIGTTINGVEVTHAGMVDVHHLGGATGLKKFLESNGSYNPADDNDTTLTDYLKRGGEATAGTQAQAQAEVDPLANLRNIGGSLGDAIGRGEPGLNLISGTEATPAQSIIPPFGPGAQGRGELGPNQLPSTAIPRGPETTAAASIAATVARQEGREVGEDGPIISVEETVRPPEVTEMIEDPRKFRKAREQSIMANPFLTDTQMIAKFDSMNDATNRGEAENIRVEAAARIEHLVSVATKWADDPNSSTKLEDLQKILSDIPGTALEKVAAGLYALEIGKGALAYKIKPNYIVDPSVARGVQGELVRNRKTLEIQPIHQISNLAKLFGDDDPTTAMENYVKSKNDGEAQTPYWFGIGADATAENSVRQLVHFIAEEAGVTPAIAAAAMSVRFTPDPDGFFDSFNTNENRFDKTGTIAWLRANANENSLLIYEGDVERVARREDELNSGGVRLSVMQHQFKKMNDSNTTPQQRKDAKQAITSLQNTLKAGRTPLDGVMALAKYIGHDEGGLGIAKHLRSLEVGSPEHKEAVEFVRISIESDTSISASHKRLLLAAINS